VGLFGCKRGCKTWFVGPVALFGHTKKTLRKFQSFSETKVVFFFGGGLHTRLKVNIFEPNNEGLEDDFPFSIG